MRFWKLVCLIAVCVCATLTLPHLGAQPDDMVQVREVLNKLSHAVEARDIDGVMAVYSPDVVAFDIVPPLSYRGATAYKGNYSSLFSSFEGPVKIEYEQLSITANGKLAFCHAIQHFTGKPKDGEAVNIYLRTTDCLEKRDGKWLIVHEHASVPTDLGTGKAELELKPEKP